MTELTNFWSGPLEANRATIDNIRLWDWQPLMDTYAQLQEIRTYYKFHDADIDRYVQPRFAARSRNLPQPAARCLR